LLWLTCSIAPKKPEEKRRRIKLPLAVSPYGQRARLAFGDRVFAITHFLYGGNF
jgi:hypothetical protein